MAEELADKQVLTEQEKEFCDRLYQLLKNQALQMNNNEHSESAAILSIKSTCKRRSGNN